MEQEKGRWPRDPGPLSPGSGVSAGAGTEQQEKSLRPQPCPWGRGGRLQGASRESHWRGGNGPLPLSGISRPPQGQWWQTAPGFLAQPCPRGPRSLPQSGTGVEVLRSPAESEPRRRPSLTLPAGPLYLLLGPSQKALLVSILRHPGPWSLSKVAREHCFLPFGAQHPRTPTLLSLSLGSHCPALPLLSLDQDAQAPVPHTFLSAPLRIGHRGSQRAECPDRGSDRVVVSRWKQQRPQGLETGKMVVPGVLASSLSSPPEPRVLTSVPGVLPAQYPAGGPQGDTTWVKADG